MLWFVWDIGYRIMGLKLNQRPLGKISELDSGLEACLRVSETVRQHDFRQKYSNDNIQGGRV